MEVPALQVRFAPSSGTMPEIVVTLPSVASFEALPLSHRPTMGGAA
jgi:hypothetical protein